MTMKTMKKRLPFLAAFSAPLLAATSVVAASNVRYLHVRVSNPANHELVRVNLPLTLAEKVIPAINHGELRDGKVHISNFTADNVNVRAILNALKTAPEGEFVTVQDSGPNSNEDVRVAKEHGQLVVHVIDKNSTSNKENVEVTIPMEVAQALISNTSENQLNIEAGIKALENVGDTTLVRVSDRDENLRVWVDSHSTDDQATSF
jgi:hypothetical protein